VFEEKSLFYFNPFYFKDGTKCKPKYFIVLKDLGDKSIVATLPSGQNYVPFPDKNLKAGCIDLPELSFKCFCFLKDTPATHTDYCFPKDTFIYGRWVEDYSLEILSLTYAVENVDYVKCGKINDDIFDEMLRCLKDSSQIKRKYKKLIEEWLR